jgi:flotillin
MIIKNLTEICQPNEILIFSGGVSKTDRRTRPYRLIHGGRAMRIPLLERVDRLDLTNMVIDLAVQGAYSKGGIALNVQGVANVKIASDEPAIGNAIERFMNVPRDAIMRVAKETLEGNLRGVLATLTPEEVNQDRIKFSQSLLVEADADLRKLGLELDMLKIQHVSDDVGYLDSLGRRQSAELQKRSRIAEAENKALSRVRGAENQENKDTARIEAAMRIAKADNDRRVRDAHSRKGAVVKEEQAIVTAAIAKAKAEIIVQRARLDQVRQQLLADEIRPAEARKTQLIEEARGHAAQIVEEGRAHAAAIHQMSRAWSKMGPDARKIIIGQKLPNLVNEMMGTIGPLNIDRLTFVDGDSGSGKLASKTAVTAEQIQQGLGVNIASLLNQFSGTSLPSLTPTIHECADSSA